MNFKIQIFWPTSKENPYDIGTWADTIYSDKLSKEETIELAQKMSSYQDRTFTKIRVIEIIDEFKCPHLENFNYES